MVLGALASTGPGGWRMQAGPSQSNVRCVRTHRPPLWLAAAATCAFTLCSLGAEPPDLFELTKSLLPDLWWEPPLRPILPVDADVPISLPHAVPIIADGWPAPMDAP